MAALVAWALPHSLKYRRRAKRNTSTITGRGETFAFGIVSSLLDTSRAHRVHDGPTRPSDVLQIRKDVTVLFSSQSLLADTTCTRLGPTSFASRVYPSNEERGKPRVKSWGWANDSAFRSKPSSRGLA